MYTVIVFVINKYLSKKVPILCDWKISDGGLDWIRQRTRSTEVESKREEAYIHDWWKPLLRS